MHYVFALLLLIQSSFGQNVITVDAEQSEFIKIGALNVTIHCISKILSDGIDGYFGSLDVINLPDISFESEFPMMKGHFEFSNMEINGVPNILAEQLDLIILPPGIKYSILIPVTFKGDYKMSAVALEIAEFAGDGKFSIQLELYLKGTASVSLIPIQVSDFKIFPELKTKIEITGIHGDAYMSKLISKQLEVVVTELASSLGGEVNKILGPFIKDTMNIFLKGDIEIPNEIITYMLSTCEA